MESWRSLAMNHGPRTRQRTKAVRLAQRGPERDKAEHAKGANIRMELFVKQVSTASGIGLQQLLHGAFDAHSAGAFEQDGIARLEKRF